MKTKKYLKHLLYVGIVFSITLLKGYVENINHIYINQNFNYNIFYLTISLFIGVCVGGVLGLKHIIREKNKEGRWKVNFPKLIIVGSPVLFISLYKIWIYNDVIFLRYIVPKALRNITVFSLTTSSVALFQLIFGYTLITSFYKTSRKI